MRKGTLLLTDEQGPLPGSRVSRLAEKPGGWQEGKSHKGLQVTSQGWRGGLAQKSGVCEAEAGIPQKLHPRGSQSPSAISGNSAGIGLGAKQRPVCPLHSKWKC